MNITALWDDLARSLLPIFQDYRSHLKDIKVSRKQDNSILSEADLAVQQHLVSKIRAIDSDAFIVAEENRATQNPSYGSNNRTWIIDPIDGTLQFLNPDSVEFCTAICLLEDRRPTAAFVLAPELGPQRSAVRISVAGAEMPVEVNGRPAQRVQPKWPWHAAIRCYKDKPEPPWAQSLRDAGFILKTEGTSQTLDLTRTCVDLESEANVPLPRFALMFRKNQSVWDGAAGRCFAQAMGLLVSDQDGIEQSTIDLDFSVTEPKFDSTLVAWPAIPLEVLNLFRNSDKIT